MEESAPPGERRKYLDDITSKSSEAMVRSVRSVPGQREGPIATERGTKGTEATQGRKSRTSIEMGFTVAEGYVVPEGAQSHGLSRHDVGPDQRHPPSDQELRDGKEQLQEWRRELLAAPRPIVKEFWLARWKRQSPKLGWATAVATEAMVDMAMAMQRAPRVKLDLVPAAVSRPGSVATRIRVCTDMPRMTLSESYLRNLPGWSSASAAAGSAASVSARTMVAETETMETATMSFTALTTDDAMRNETGAFVDSARKNEGLCPDSEEWEAVTLDSKTPDEQFFVFSEEDVVASCEDEL